MSAPIPVTRPLLPPLEEFIPYLEQIWDSHQLTNGGRSINSSRKSWPAIWASSTCRCFPTVPWP